MGDGPASVSRIHNAVSGVWNDERPYANLGLAVHARPEWLGISTPSTLRKLIGNVGFTLSP